MYLSTVFIFFFIHSFLLLLVTSPLLVLLLLLLLPLFASSFCFLFFPFSFTFFQAFHFSIFIFHCLLSLLLVFLLFVFILLFLLYFLFAVSLALCNFSFQITRSYCDFTSLRLQFRDSSISALKEKHVDRSEIALNTLAFLPQSPRSAKLCALRAVCCPSYLSLKTLSTLITQWGFLSSRILGPSQRANTKISCKVKHWSNFCPFRSYFLRKSRSPCRNKNIFNKTPKREQPKNIF